jgi:hypothetical protein
MATVSAEDLFWLAGSMHRVGVVNPLKTASKTRR